MGRAWARDIVSFDAHRAAQLLTSESGEPEAHQGVPGQRGHFRGHFMDGWHMLTWEQLCHLMAALRRREVSLQAHSARPRLVDGRHPQTG